MIKKVSKQVAKDIQELNEEKKKYETEKTMMSNKFGPKIVIDVGGILYSTSYSTLTKYPESMLGIMFSGRDAMQCQDGSFFIDRDGTQFRHILNYLRKWLSIFQGQLMLYWSFCTKQNFTGSMVLPYYSNLFCVKLMLLSRMKLHPCFCLLVVLAMHVQITEDVCLVLHTVQWIRLCLSTKI